MATIADTLLPEAQVLAGPFAGAWAGYWGVLILTQRPEPEVDVRTALLDALDLFTASQDAAGHA